MRDKFYATWNCCTIKDLDVGKVHKLKFHLKDFRTRYKGRFPEVHSTSSSRFLLSDEVGGNLY